MDKKEQQLYYIREDLTRLLKDVNDLLYRFRTDISNECLFSQVEYLRFKVLQLSGMDEDIIQKLYNDYCERNKQTFYQHICSLEKEILKKVD